MFKVGLPATADEIVISYQLHKVSGVFFERSKGKIVSMPVASNEDEIVSISNVSGPIQGT